MTDIQQQRWQTAGTGAAPRPASLFAEGTYAWVPPTSASAPAASSGAPMGPSMGAPPVVDANPSSRRAVRLINLRPMRELRVLLPEAPEQDQLVTDGEGRHTVAVKLLGSGASDSRLGPRGLRVGAANAAATAAAVASGCSNPSGGVGAGIPAAGTAEIFGVELLPDVEVELPLAARLAIFTWGGCTLQIRGQVQQEYEASDIAMGFVLNFSAALDARRRAAAAKQTAGPRVLVTGSSGSGKSSVCQLLCNYALRSGWTPAFVELDARGSCDKGALQMPPGCVGCCVCRSLEAEEPEDLLVFFLGSSCSPPPAGSSASSSNAAGAAARAAPKPPIVEMADATEDPAAAAAAAAGAAGAAGGGTAADAAADGATGPSDVTLELFPWVCSCLSTAIHSAFAQSLLQHAAAAAGDGDAEDSSGYNETQPPSLAASGLIANAPHQASLQQLQQLVEIFGFDVVVVLDHPSLCHDLAGVYGHVLPDTAEEATAQQQQQLQQQQQQQMHTAGKAAGSLLQRVEVIPMPKLEGTVAPDAARLRMLRRLWLRRYFLGPSSRCLPPQTLRVSLGQCTLLQMTQKAALPLSAMPADSSATESSRLQLGPWRGSAAALLNAILAVPATRDPRNLPWASVACLVHVCSVEVDGDDQVLHLRVPGGMGEALAAPLLLVPHDLRSMKCVLDA